MNKAIANSIIYEAYPVSFFDTNGDGIGDLEGIYQKLEYIRQFADIVWVNPVYKSPFRDGGYDISDYYQIDARFGTMADVSRLTEKAHGLGMKIIFDLVVGHTSDEHPWFKASQKDEKNAYSDYYIWTDDALGATDRKFINGNSERNGNYMVNYFCFQPALNFGYAKKEQTWQMAYTDPACQAVRREVEKIIKHYLRLGVDGFRVDLASSIVKGDFHGKCSCEVWSEIFGNVRKEYPDAIFLAEWGQPEYAIGSGAYDIDYINHCFQDGYNRLFRKESGMNVIKSEGHSYFRRDAQGETDAFFEYFLHHLEKTKDKGYISVPTGNHDLPRISMGRTNEEMKTVFASLLALPGIPLIYYGDEIGMPYSHLKNKDGGYCRTGSRTPMQWTDGKNAGFSDTDGALYLPVNENYKAVNVASQESDPDSLLNEVKKLVSIKRRYRDVFAFSPDITVVSGAYPLVFRRSTPGGTLTCMFNPGAATVTAEAAPGKVLAGKNFAIKDKTVTLSGDAYLWLLDD